MIAGFTLIHDVTLADRRILEGGNFFDYIWVGAKHMLTGYDHLLFLLGVVFFLTSFKDILIDQKITDLESRSGQKSNEKK